MEHTLTHSVNGCSPACNVNVAVCVLFGSLELMFLIAEHEMLLKASDSSYMPPEHPAFSTSGSSIPRPTHPDPQLLKRFYIRCGVGQTVPMKDGLDRTLEPLLSKYRASLPYACWRAVCIQTLRVLQALVDALTEPAGDAKGSIHDDVGSTGMGHGSGPGAVSVGEATQKGNISASNTSPEQVLTFHYELTSACMSYCTEVTV